MKYYDDLEPSIERFSKRKDRRKPRGRRSIRQLTLASEQEAITSRFDDPGLQELYERGQLSELLWQLKSGKEATVYVADGPMGLLAAKIYTNLQVRTFRNDRIYREGRYIADQRLQRAIDERSRTGLAAQQALWIAEEYLQLEALYRAGISVPEPVAQAGSVVLMKFIGDEERPAPRLADLKLAPYEAEDAFWQSVEQMGKMLAIGRVHGDYSTFNLLWWQGRVVVIDFPQVVNIKENQRAWQLLERDAQSLCKSFRKLGLTPEPNEVLREVREMAGII